MYPVSGYRISADHSPDGRMTDLYFFLSEDREGSAVQQHRGLLSEQHRSHLQNARSPQNAGKWYHMRQEPYSHPC